MSETTREERERILEWFAQGCPRDNGIPQYLQHCINDADRLAAIERDVGLLEDELRKFAPGKADVLFIVSRLRAIRDPEGS